jgi:hypothetical protein
LKSGSVVKKRVSLRNLADDIIKHGNFDCAIAVFDDGTNWRVSFVSGVKGSATSPKRYTYVFGDKEYYHTACKRFLNLQGGKADFNSLTL